MDVTYTSRLKRAIRSSWIILRELGKKYCIVLYCIVLYCIVLYCIILYCIVMYCIVLYCIVLYCTVLYCIVWYYTRLYCIVLHRCLLHGIVMQQGMWRLSRPVEKSSQAQYSVLRFIVYEELFRDIQCNFIQLSMMLHNARYSITKRLSLRSLTLNGIKVRFTVQCTRAIG